MLSSIGGCVAIGGLDCLLVYEVGFIVIDTSPLASGWSVDSRSPIRSLGTSSFTGTRCSDLYNSPISTYLKRAGAGL